MNIQHTDVFLIDEYSMMKNTIQEKIDDILCKLSTNIEDSRKAFGNKSLIYFGDISQLPPVIKSHQDERPI